MRTKSSSLLLLAVLLLTTTVRAQNGSRTVRFEDVGGESIETMLRQAEALPDSINGPIRPHVEPQVEEQNRFRSKVQSVVRPSKSKFDTLPISTQTRSASPTELLPTPPAPQHDGFDVRNPVDVEMLDSNSSPYPTHDTRGANYDSMGQGQPYFGHTELDAFANLYGSVPHSPGSDQLVDNSALTSGYDGLVDSYVQDLLLNGCSTNLPCGSIECPPMQTNCMPCSDTSVTGWYAQAQVLFLQPWGLESLDTTVSNATGGTVLATDGLHQDWVSGVDARIGLRTGYSSIEFGWWSMFSDNDQATATSGASDLFSVINFIELDVDFNNAQLHQLESEIELHTFELSKRHLLSGWNAGALRFAYMWGVRFTRLSDELRFLADVDNTTLGDATGEMAYEIEVDNRLFGPQVGGSIQWQINERLSAMLDAKAGLFYNNIDQTQFASSSAGPATIVAGPDTGRLFDIDQTHHQASMLTELQFNLEYTLSHRARLLVGYRAFAASGVALSRSQVPWRFGSLNASEVDASDSLMLHGFQVGFDASF